MKEILALADECHLVFGSIAPDLDVRGLGEATVKNMLAFDSTGAQKPRQCNWKLVVDQECHETCKTA
jgi:hypothetical protein